MITSKRLFVMQFERLPRTHLVTREGICFIGGADATKGT